jgi:Fe-S cluster assembly protein SufD
VTPFSADAAAALVGPDWLRARRAAALDRFSATALPSPEEELWRYSRVAELDLDRYAPALEAPTGEAVLPADVEAVLDAAGPRSALVVLRNGHLVSVEGGAPGLEVGPLADVDPSGEALGAVAGEPADAFASLHDAFVADPVLVRVARGAVVTDPVVVVSLVEGDGTAAFPRLVVSAGEDSELTVYGHTASAPGVDALVVPVVELDAGQAARLRYLDAQLLGQSVWQLGHQTSRVGRDAAFATTMVSLGGDYARLRIDSALDGRGASGEMQAVYFGEGTQMHDMRTLQDHVAPRTRSNLLFKGVVQGTSHAVYSGLIHIGKEAAGVDAFQTNRNIKLSDGAWAESVPNLEIENNDVRCSHASAVGPVDEEQRFYLESRGVGPAAAERLIVLGFFEEVLDRLPVPGAKGPLRAEVARKLDRREAP